MSEDRPLDKGADDRESTLYWVCLQMIVSYLPWWSWQVRMCRLCSQEGKFASHWCHVQSPETWGSNTIPGVSKQNLVGYAEQFQCGFACTQTASTLRQLESGRNCSVYRWVHVQSLTQLWYGVVQLSSAEMPRCQDHKPAQLNVSDVPKMCQHGRLLSFNASRTWLLCLGKANDRDSVSQVWEGAEDRAFGAAAQEPIRFLVCSRQKTMEVTSWLLLCSRVIVLSWFEINWMFCVVLNPFITSISEALYMTWPFDLCSDGVVCVVYSTPGSDERLMGQRMAINTTITYDYYPMNYVFHKPNEVSRCEHWRHWFSRAESDCEHCGVLTLIGLGEPVAPTVLAPSVQATGNVTWPNEGEFVSF